MTITEITEVENKNIKKQKPIKEKMDKFIPGIDPKMNIPNRNGMVFVLNGSGGSGKTSLLLNMMKDKAMYKKKFDNIYYFCPESSFRSAESHPFKDHDKVYHELNNDALIDLYNKLDALRKEEEEEVIDPETGEKSIIKHDPKYNLCIIDDFADTLKDKSMMAMWSKLLIKARHLCCGFIFTLQSYLYFPKILRKQVTNIIIFKPKNTEEFITLGKELFNMNMDDSLTLFKYCFDEGSYNHLDIDTWTNKYYKNFNDLEIKFS